MDTDIRRRVSCLVAAEDISERACRRQAKQRRTRSRRFAAQLPAHEASRGSYGAPRILEDLREAGGVVRGRHVAGHVKQALVVPGSGLVKRQAEEEGLDRIFTEAGFEWREPGCSMCLAMNPDKVPPGERCASTSNRNFVGRQGPGARTHLMSPAMAAAAAVTGRLTDVRELLG